jgi:small-conductance mechanosensitive channel
MGGGSKLAAVTVSRFVRGLIVVLGFAIAMWIVGVDLGPILFFTITILLLIGVSFGAALADYLAGIILTARRPFEKGDLVEIEGFRGRVSDHDLRAVTLRTIDQETVIIPNRVAIGAIIRNATPDGPWRSSFPVGVAYGSDLARAREVVLAAVGGLPGVHADPPPRVRYRELADSSVTFDVIVFHDPTMVALEEVRDGVITAVHDALAAAGITIPFPQRDVWIRSEDG